MTDNTYWGELVHIMDHAMERSMELSSKLCWRNMCSFVSCIERRAVHTSGKRTSATSLKGVDFQQLLIHSLLCMGSLRMEDHRKVKHSWVLRYILSLYILPVDINTEAVSW